MPQQRNVRFESPQSGVQSPSHSSDFVFDFASSDDGASEKDIGQEKCIEQRQAQRPKSTPWTSRPQALRERLRIRWWRDIIVDTVSILMPLPFLILSVIILVVNGKETDDWSLSALEQSIKGVSLTRSALRDQSNLIKATTIFPIFFASLTGRAALK
jgi:hypothetical protein